MRRNTGYGNRRSEIYKSLRYRHTSETTGGTADFSYTNAVDWNHDIFHISLWFHIPWAVLWYRNLRQSRRIEKRIRKVGDDCERRREKWKNPKIATTSLPKWRRRASLTPFFYQRTRNRKFRMFSHCMWSKASSVYTSPCCHLNKSLLTYSTTTLTGEHFPPLHLLSETLQAAIPRVTSIRASRTILSPGPETGFPSRCFPTFSQIISLPK